MHATLIPGPNLARRIASAGAIVTGKLVRGTTLASGSQVSSDFVLHVDRVLKGDLIVGTEIPAHLEGRGMFMEPAPKHTAIPPIFGIWFLNTAAQPYGVIARDGTIGEINFAPVILPGEAPPGKPGATPAASVANEMISALGWLAALAATCGEDRDRFFAAAALASEQDFFDPRADRVALMTMHAAKGLEFPVVFVVGLEEGLMPLVFGAPDAAAEAEERRLLYVAMTRARDRLYLTRAAERLWRGRLRRPEPSRFLADIEAELVRHHRVALPGRKPQHLQLELF